MPDYDPKLAQDLLKQANYKGDPIPYRLLNNYYTNQVATAQVLVEMWKQVGLNVEIEMKENWTQIIERAPNRAVRDWSNSAAFNDPVSSIVAQHGPNGQQQQIGEWTNVELNKLSEFLETSTDRAARKQGVPPHAGDLPSAKTPPIRCCTRTRPSPPSRSRSNGRRRPPSRWISAPAISRPEAVAPAGQHPRACSVAFNGVPVLRGVDLALGKGEALGLVGESGWASR